MEKHQQGRAGYLGCINRVSVAVHGLSVLSLPVVHACPVS